MNHLHRSDDGPESPAFAKSPRAVGANLPAAFEHRLATGFAGRMAAAILLAAVSFSALSGCSSGSARTTSQTPIISVAMVQLPPPSMTVGTATQVSATVTNDVANAGVDWVASCGSAPRCGTFSPAHTDSGVTTTFLAPATVPSGKSISISALSATDHSKASAFSVTIISTVTAITITQPPPVSAPAGSLVMFGATVTGDTSNEGVDWKMTCGGIDCTPTGLHSDSGVPVSVTVPGPSQIPNIVGSSVVATAYATADHSFSALTTFKVTQPISVSITQAPPTTMLTNATATIVAVVQNDTANSGVTWTVSCATAPCGTITPSQTASGASAIFTAPSTVPAPNPNPNPDVTITARATAGSASSIAAVTVTIVAPISVKITQGVPTNSIVKNGTAQLIATVTEDAVNAGVDWSVSCGTAGSCGTFSPAHTASGGTTTFTAPNGTPAGGTVTISAAATTDPTQTDSQTVTVTSNVTPNSLLLGPFVVLLSGKNSSNGPFAVGGIVTGDGNGNITSANLDLADASGNASTSVSLLAPGTCAIGADGRGQIKLQINTAPLNGSFGEQGSGKITLSVVFVTPQHALLNETDTFGNGSGTLDLQNATDLNAFQQGAWHNGTYSLKLSGTQSAAPYSGYYLASALTMDFSVSGYSYVTDQSADGIITSVPFTSTTQNFAISRDQSGKLSLASLNLGLPTQFSLDAWLIDATHFAVTDWRDSVTGTPPMISAGYLTIQPSSPALSGVFAFTEAGATAASQPQVAGGIFACGSTGTLDVVPLAGTGLSNQAISTTCTAPTNGRGLLSISGAASAGINQFAAYPTADRGTYLIEIDGGTSGTAGASGAGIAMQQTLAAPIPASALTGKYASNFTASTGPGSESFAAQIIFDGVSALTGTADVNSFDTTASPLTGVPSSGATLTGSYSAGSSGRFPLALTITPAAGQPPPQVTNLNQACYLVDASTCLLLGLDATAPGTGVLLLQNTGL